MSSQTTTPDAAGIPQQIIEKFLEQLSAEQVSPAVIAKLRKAILEKGDISETAIKAALTAAETRND